MIYKVIFNKNDYHDYYTLMEVNIKWHLNLQDWMLPQIIELDGREALIDKFDKNFIIR